MHGGIVIIVVVVARGAMTSHHCCHCRGLRSGTGTSRCNGGGTWGRDVAPHCVVVIVVGEGGCRDVAW